MAKTWVVTLQSKNSANDTKVIEHISGRKKIGQIDDHLCNLYEELFPGAVSAVHLKASIKHPSGSQTILETSDMKLFASLTEVEE
jgi:hypothetical protein